MTQVGGFKDARELSEEELVFVIALQPHIQEKASKEFETFKPVQIKSQVVAGTNYLVKVDVGSDQFIIVKIFKPLPYTNADPEIKEVTQGVTSHDEL